MGLLDILPTVVAAGILLETEEIAFDREKTKEVEKKSDSEEEKKLKEEKLEREKRKRDTGRLLDLLVIGVVAEQMTKK
jgi:hypothetical protein